jgi:orotate phosphoribosyltransferase
VRKEAKDYGTERQLEGEFAPGERVCLVEDVVTSGGAAAEAVVALRAAGLECDTAVCVVDREEGGADALAEAGVRLHALFRARDVLEA